MCNTVHISTKISKIGEMIPCVSLPPIETCRSDAPCKKLCYATKGRFRFQNVKNCLWRNLEIYNTNSAEFFKQANGFLDMIPYKYFRWFSAGDIPDISFLEEMCKLAKQHKGTQFLCFTKKYELVNSYIGSDCRIPENLHIVFSRWGNFPCENPHNFPEAWIAFKNEDNAEIPTYARECSGNCSECVSTKGNCWNLKKGEAVYFHQH